MVVDHYTVHTLSKQALQYTVSHLLHRLVAVPLQHSSHFTPESKTKMTQLKRTVKKHFCDMLSYTLHFFLLALGDNPRDTKRACLHTSYGCCSRRQFHGVIDPSGVITKQRNRTECSKLQLF